MQSVEMKEDKKAFRERMKQVLTAFCNDRVRAARSSMATTEKLMQSAIWQDAPAVLLYVSTIHEIDTSRLIECAIRGGKLVGLPKVEGRGIMDFRHIAENIPLAEQLVPGAFHILEPSPSLPRIAMLPPCSLIVCPGVAFTRSGWRLGHGGGYYDRYISSISPRQCRIVGVCFPCQIVRSLPHDDHDMRMDKVFYGW